jgi:hypothetical protein
LFAPPEELRRCSFRFFDEVEMTATKHAANPQYRKAGLASNQVIIFGSLRVMVCDAIEKVYIPAAT